MTKHKTPPPPPVPKATARALRSLPQTWRAPTHAPTTLPTSYPALLDLVKLPHGTEDVAFRAPQLTYPVPRSTNEHLLLAQRGDALIRCVLLGIGAELELTLSGRHQLVAQVGSNASLAQICLESGVLDAAIDASPFKVSVKSVCYKAAAGVFEALAAVLEDELGLATATDALKVVLYPWVNAVVVEKVVTHILVTHGAKAAAALVGRVAEEMAAVLGAEAGSKSALSDIQNGYVTIDRC